MKRKELLISLFVVMTFGLNLAQAGDPQRKKSLDDAFSSGTAFPAESKPAGKSSVREKLFDRVRVQTSHDPEVVARRKAQRDPYISACLNDPAVPVGKEVRITNRSYRYWAKKEEDVVKIRMSIYFTYPGEERERNTVRKAIKELPACIRGFYAYGGLLVEMIPYFDSGSQDMARADNVIASMPQSHTYRADAKNWNVFDCGIAIHEFGHLLGLPDEYIDAQTSNKSFIGEENSVMRDYKPINAALYPRHIKSILDPLCVPDYDKKQTQRNRKDREFMDDYHDYWANKAKKKEGGE
ncbi:hypothetical protein ACFL6Y_11960 [Elusimicrobiota bacterium]